MQAPANKPDALHYSAARPRFIAGDLLCFKGRGFVSWAIRRVTKSDYSHVGLVFNYESRVFCLESVGTGVRLILMSELVRHYEGGIDYFSIKASEAEKKSAISWAFGQLGKKYDTIGIYRFLRHIMGGDVSVMRQNDEWFCSELVAKAYKEAGVTLVDGEKPAFTSPSDIVKSGLVMGEFAVKRG